MANVYSNRRVNIPASNINEQSGRTTERLGYLNFYLPYEVDGETKRAKLGIKGLEFVGSDTPKGEQMREIHQALESGAISPVDLLRQLLDIDGMVEYTSVSGSNDAARTTKLNLNINAQAKAANA